MTPFFTIQNIGLVLLLLAARLFMPHQRHCSHPSFLQNGSGGGQGPLQCSVTLTNLKVTTSSCERTVH
jgi:hypothetical protein